MVAIYLLLHLIANISSEASLVFTELKPVEFSVMVEDAELLRSGAPVFANGLYVGAVTDVQKTEKEDYSVNVQVSPFYRTLIRTKTVGLMSTPMLAEKKSADTILELLTLPEAETSKMLNSGGSINGFSSFESFWSSGA